MNTKREDMNIKTLAVQLGGKKFGQLVLKQYSEMKLGTLIAAMRGTIENLPQRAQAYVPQWIDDASQEGIYAAFWAQDCGEALTRLSSRSKATLLNLGVDANDEDLFNMFQIIVLNSAYAAHKHPQSKAFIQKSIGIGFIRRLFG
jgi:hypothetical protein